MASLAYVLLLAVVALGVPLARNLSARVNAEVRTQAQGQADLVAATAADLLRQDQRRDLATLVRTAASSIRGRVLVVGAGGIAIADSASPPQLGVSYVSRPEIAGALAGRQLQVQRRSATLAQQILATAVPIIRNGRPAGAVRVTQSMSAVHSAVRRAELGLVLIGAIVLALGLAAGAILARYIARPIRRLDAAARRVAQGDLGARAAVEGSSEQRSLAASFNEMTARIERLLEAQREFLADASHQLRTPLTGLRLRLEEARAIHGDDATAAEIDAAMGEVDRLAHTVEEFLVLSRAGERRTIAVPVRLGEVADAALERWRAAADARGIALVREDRTTGAMSRASLPDLARALDALIENALQYSPPHTCVTIRSAPGVLEVLDRGPGLAPGEEQAVIERFHRGRAAGGSPGSGLGLSIVRELARGWRGEITLENRQVGGTIARLTVPEPEVATGDLPALNPQPSTLG